MPSVRCVGLALAIALGLARADVALAAWVDVANIESVRTIPVGSEDPRSNIGAFDQDPLRATVGGRNLFWDKVCFWPAFAEVAEGL